MNTNLYHYNAKADRVIDGDTAVLVMDLGFRMFTVASCRLAGIDTPELNSSDIEQRTKAQAARTALMGYIMDKTLVVRSEKLDKYGRPVVTIFVQDGEDWVNVNEQMVADGHATVY